MAATTEKKRGLSKIFFPAAAAAISRKRGRRDVAHVRPIFYSESRWRRRIEPFHHQNYRNMQGSQVMKMVRALIEAKMVIHENCNSGSGNSYGQIFRVCASLLLLLGETFSSGREWGLFKELQILPS